jgi:hypothetical protein
MLFRDLFNDTRISDERLGVFGDNTLERFKTQNTSAQYKDIIDLMEASLIKFKSESGDISLAVALQRGLTITTDMLVSDLHVTMRDAQNEIIFKLGGEDKPNYLAIYPHGLSEYLQATKTQMPTITDRLFKAAALNEAVLGKTMTDKLKSYQLLWKNARDVQTDKKTEVSTDRTERNESRYGLEIALTRAVHIIGDKFPDDLDKCGQFFEFHLLYKPQHEKPLAPTQTN